MIQCDSFQLDWVENECVIEEAETETFTFADASIHATIDAFTATEPAVKGNISTR